MNQIMIRVSQLIVSIVGVLNLIADRTRDDWSVTERGLVELIRTGSNDDAIGF